METPITRWLLYHFSLDLIIFKQCPYSLAALTFYLSHAMYFEFSDGFRPAVNSLLEQIAKAVSIEWIFYTTVLETLFKSLLLLASKRIIWSNESHKLSRSIDNHKIEYLRFSNHTIVCYSKPIISFEVRWGYIHTALLTRCILTFSLKPVQLDLVNLQINGYKENVWLGERILCSSFRESRASNYFRL